MARGGDPSRCRAWNRRQTRRTPPDRSRTVPPPAPSSGTCGSSCRPSPDRRRRPSIGPATDPGSGAPAFHRKAGRRRTDRRGGLDSTGRPWPEYRGRRAGLTSPAWPLT
ncbi:hypothetical protein [Azospirillum palustre]